jgi:hypothetical protein
VTEMRRVGTGGGEVGEHADVAVGAPEAVGVVGAVGRRAEPVSPVEVALGEGRDPRWEELWELAQRVGPSPELAHLDDRGLERGLRVGASRLASETCRWLGLLAELVIRGVWADQGARTPAVWLSWALGIAPATARDQVRVALRLRELDRVRERFAAGRISYSKVRAITRVAVPELEEMLLDWADGSTAAELEAAVRGFRRAQRGLTVDPDEVERRRGVWVVDHADGTSDLVIRLPTDEARAAHAHAQRLAALEVHAEQQEDGGASAAARASVHDQTPGASAAAPDGVHGPSPVDSTASAILMEGCGASAASRPYGARVADALVQALAAAVASGPADTSGQDRDTLVVHVNETDLDRAQGPPVAVETSAGPVPAMSRRVLRRLACEAGVVFVATDGDGSPVDVARRDRRLSAALRRALRSRDRSCRFPGCGSRRHLHAHHVVHWADGGPTDLANLVLLCGHHHRYVHAHDYDIDVRPDGAHTFHHSTGRRLPRARSLPGGDSWRAPTGAQPLDTAFGHPDRGPEAEQVVITPDALQPAYWDGYFDLDTTVAVLQQQFRLVRPDTALAA